MNTNINNCFQGSHALVDFLNPACRGALPLVELTDPTLNPFLNSNNRVRIFGCLGFMNPFLNTKGDVVYNMLKMAQNSGRLEGVHTIVENSSGNTAAALGVLGPLFGIRRIRAITPWDRAPGKGEVIRLLSVDEELVKRDGIKLAQNMGKEKGCINLNQYDNPDNPKTFDTYLAPGIWEQTNGALTVFSAALGSSGTLIGCSDFFRSQKSERPSGEKVFIVGVNVAPNQAVPGARTLERLQEITLPWKEAMNTRMEVGTKESYVMSLRLIQRGLFAGPSSGLALVGLHEMLKAWLTQNGDFSGLRNKAGDVLAVVVFADTFLPYMDKYSTVLDPEDFSADGGYIGDNI